MSRLLLGACVALSIYGVASLALSLGLAGLLRAGCWRSDRCSAASLLALRLVPALFAGLLALGLVVPAWLVLEPDASGEPVAPQLFAFALLGGLPLGLGLARGLRDVLASRRLAAEWRARARSRRLGACRREALVFSHRFPVVALAGVLRPRLFVAEDVVERLSSDELEAALSHEEAHARRSDNLRRLLLRACPDWLGLLPAAREIEAAWSQASELEADAHASAGGPRAAVSLASALVAVARLAPAAPVALPASALHDGASVAARVRRLLDQRAPERRAPRAQGAPDAALAAAALALPALVVAAVASPSLLRAVQGLAEEVVRALR